MAEIYTAALSGTLAGSDADLIRHAAGKRKTPAFAGVLFLAEWTGLEPATPGVTGRYSNQLNYHS
jgi:hypothetical protein